jgi:hypothetical protein
MDVKRKNILKERAGGFPSDSGKVRLNSDAKLMVSELSFGRVDRVLESIPGLSCQAFLCRTQSLYHQKFSNPD